MSDWNDLAKELVLDVIAIGTVENPVIGAVVGSIVTLFWPDDEESAWDKCKNQVRKLVRKEILDVELERIDAHLSTAYKKLKDYHDTVDDDNANLAELGYAAKQLDDAIDACDALYSVLYTMKIDNRKHFVSYIVCASAMHINAYYEMISHESALFGSARYRNTHIDNIIEAYGNYENLIKETLSAWYIWRNDQIKANSEFLWFRWFWQNHYSGCVDDQAYGKDNTPKQGEHSIRTDKVYKESYNLSYGEVVPSMKSMWMSLLNAEQHNDIVAMFKARVIVERAAAQGDEGIRKLTSIAEKTEISLRRVEVGPICPESLNMTYTFHHVEFGDYQKTTQGKIRDIRVWHKDHEIKVIELQFDNGSTSVLEAGDKSGESYTLSIPADRMLVGLGFSFPSTTVAGRLNGLTIYHCDPKDGSKPIESETFDCGSYDTAEHDSVSISNIQNYVLFGSDFEITGLMGGRKTYQGHHYEGFTGLGIMLTYAANNDVETDGVRAARDIGGRKGVNPLTLRCTV